MTAGWLALLSHTMAAPADKPNVVSIVLDDLRPEVGCYGADDVKSPNIDRLAAKGMLFRRNGYFTAGIGKVFHLGEDAKGEDAKFRDPKSWDHFSDSLNAAPAIDRKGDPPLSPFPDRLSSVFSSLGEKANSYHSFIIHCPTPSP